MMKKWVVCYDHGPHMATEVIVEARYADTARKRGIAAARAKGHHPLINWVKLVGPVVEQEQESEMKESTRVYIVCFRGTVYCVYDSQKKALAGAKAEYGDLYDVEILEKEVK